MTEIFHMVLPGDAPLAKEGVYTPIHFVNFMHPDPKNGIDVLFHWLVEVTPIERPTCQ